MLEISVLGPLEVRVDGEAVDVVGEIARRILVGIALEQPVSTDRLVDIAWGSDPPRTAKAALQTQISRLRTRLGRDAIVGSGGSYRLENAEVDAARLEALLERGDIDSLDEAVNLVRGEPLSDIGDSEELVGSQRALIEIVQSARLRLSEELVMSGRPAEAIPLLERITGSSPLLEPAWLVLARATHAAGRQRDAIDALDRYRQAVAEAGLEPSEAVAVVEEQVFATPTVGAGRRSIVRPRSSTFIGRRQELDELAELVSRRRMITVTGPGGMGKTRIAEAVGLLVQERFTGGVVTVELSADATPPEIPASIARAFGVRAADDPLSAVASAIGTDTTVLLLDNCEHLVEASRDVAQRLLREAPSLTILATSRIPLGVDGEMLFHLDPLGAESAGVDLFFDRAAAAGAPVLDSDRPAVARLCRRLDGMPLAIEMAAARARTVTPDELTMLLEASQTVLEAPGPERHRTLDALVEWSYGRLQPAEQRVFRTLGAFAGGFEARDVARILGISLDAAVTSLGRLVDHSLCRSDRGPHGVEFRLLETLKMSARDRLHAAGETEEVMSAHGAWAAELASRALTMPDRADETAVAARLVRGIPDVIAAHSRAVARDDLDLQVRLLAPLFPMIYLVMPPGIADPARATLERARHLDHPLLPWLDAVAAAYELAAGRPDSAERHLEAGRDHPAGSNAWPVWFMTTDLAVYHGRLDIGRESNRELMRLADDVATEWRPAGWTDGLITEALIACYGGRAEDAVATAHRALERARAHGAPSYVAFAEYTMGEVHQDIDAHRSLDHLHRAADIARRAGIPFVEGIARTTIASVLARTDRITEALTEFQGLIEHLEKTGARIHLWTALRNLIVLLGEVEAWDDVATLLGATGGRVSPTYGDEERRLARTADEARGHTATFDEAFAEGGRMSPSEVGPLARTIIDRLIGDERP